MKGYLVVFFGLILFTACPFNRDDSTVVLHCVSVLSDSSEYVIDFKDNNTYDTYIEGQPGMQSGTYTLADSVYTLAPSTKSQLGGTKFLLRTAVSIYEKDSIPGLDTIKKALLYQLDSKGAIPDVPLFFEVRK